MNRPHLLAQPCPDLDALLDAKLPLHEIESRVRSYCIHYALHKALCNHGRAAEALSIHRNTLTRALGLTGGQR